MVKQELAWKNRALRVHFERFELNAGSGAVCGQRDAAARGGPRCAGKCEQDTLFWQLLIIDPIFDR